MRRKLMTAFLAAIVTALLAQPAAATDFIVPLRAPVPGSPPALQMRALRVEAEAADGVARVRLDQTFVNQSSANAEGTYLFPVPEGASVSTFQMFIDGQAYNAEVLDANQARAIYEGIVRRNRDPALLQYVGRGLLQASVFPVPPGEERTIRVEYEQVLNRDRDGGLFELSVPLGQEKIPRVTGSISLRGVGQGSIYSPTHEVGVTRKGDGAASVSFEGADMAGTFQLFFGSATTEMGVNLLSYKTRNEDGYFMLLVNPPSRSDKMEIVAKDVILALDLSGSMSGQKFEQAKGAALHILGALNRNDRFAVVGFHGDTITYADQLSPATEAPEAMAWVRSLKLGGSTNISGAMEQAQAIAGANAGRPQVIVLITDGVPTAGEVFVDKIVQGVKTRATASQRIFTFGVGFDVNTDLLDEMAQEFRGRSEYVKPGENLESAVELFWRKVGQPVLSDVTVEWNGVKTDQIYPRPLPDLYLGSQMVVLGRYRSGGEGSITLKGKVNGETRTYRFSDLRFATSDSSKDYIPRLWASRKVGYLLGEIKRNGTNKELVDEVIALSQRFGIVTPYTSMFINEPGQPMPVVTNGGAPRTVTPPGSAAYAPAPAPAMESKKVADAIAAAPATGVQAVQQAEQVGKLREADRIQQSPAPSDQVKTVGDKSFVLRGGTWTDTAYTGGDLIHLKLGSDKYLELARLRPDLARCLAVGSPLILMDGDHAYGIDIPGNDESDVDIKAGLVSSTGSAPGGPARLIAFAGVAAAALAAVAAVALRLRRRRLAEQT